jgi:hypothetical protein
VTCLLSGKKETNAFTGLQQLTTQALRGHPLRPSRFHCENRFRNKSHVLWFSPSTLFTGFSQHHVVLKMAGSEFRNGTVKTIPRVATEPFLLRIGTLRLGKGVQLVKEHCFRLLGVYGGIRAERA